jgi:hypothetical protein
MKKTTMILLAREQAFVGADREGGARQSTPICAILGKFKQK